MALQRFRVTGVMPIRDAVTKESVQQGGIVTLDDEPVARTTGKPLAGTIRPGDFGRLASNALLPIRNDMLAAWPSAAVL